MGRARRRRRQKKPRKFCTCDYNQEIILLNSWLSKNGIRKNEKLGLAMFDDTGRGVLTRKKIKPGEELLNLPLNLTINVTTILTDLSFCNIFLENQKQCLLEYKHSISFQSMMAFYLAYLKVQDENSMWGIYMESLPKEYTVPYFLPNEIKCSIDADILAVISKQKDVIDLSFNIFVTVLKNNLSVDSSVQSLKKMFTKSDYEWAYFTVNTRCVYMDLTKVIDLKNIGNSILNLISDNTKISLCPYLDMINHSPNARNEAQLIVSKDIENIKVRDLKRDILSDVRFSIYTKNNVNPYSEVFICYGDSHNLKLITEYGFFLPNNDLDFVSFTYENVKTFLSSSKFKLSQEQLSFIDSHGLNKDLYIDIRGLSYNFYGFLMVVKYYYNHGKDVSKLLYSAAICSTDNSLNDIVAPMVVEKLVIIKESINKLNVCETKCVILDNCVELMCQYVKILENFIKC